MSAAVTPGTEREPSALPRWLAAIIVGAIALASLAALLWPLIQPKPTDPGVIREQIEQPDSAGRIGAKAPDFAWTAPDGRAVRLSDLRGSVVVINFWATWCEPCREEMPTLQRVAASEPGVVFLQVDLQESAEKVESFLAQLGLSDLETVLDTDGATARRYGVLSLPSTFFVDRDGVIRHLDLGGPMTEQEIRTGIGKARR